MPSSWSWPEPSCSSPTPPTRSDWQWSLQWWSLPLLWWGLPNKRLFVSVDAVVGIELLATTSNAGKHMATVLPNYVLAWHLQRLESFVTDITEVNPFSLLCFVPPHRSHPATTWFSSKPALDTCRSRCQQMTIPLHVFLKDDPRLEGDVADDKADSSVCLQINQISFLHFFLETAGSTTNMCLGRLFKKKKVLATVVALFWQTGKGGEWQIILCLRRHQLIHDVGSLCISPKGCWTSSWWQEPWSRSCRWRRQVAKGTEGNFTNMPSSTTRRSSTITYLLFPSISYSSS